MTFKAKCTQCGGETRLVGIEPHHKIAGVDIWTLECTNCGHTDIEMPRREARSPMPEGSRPRSQDEDSLKRSRSRMDASWTNAR